MKKLAILLLFFDLLQAADAPNDTMTLEFFDGEKKSGYEPIVLKKAEFFENLLGENGDNEVSLANFNISKDTFNRLYKLMKKLPNIADIENNTKENIDRLMRLGDYDQVKSSITRRIKKFSLEQSGKLLAATEQLVAPDFIHGALLNQFSYQFLQSDNALRNFASKGPGYIKEFGLDEAVLKHPFTFADYHHVPNMPPLVSKIREFADRRMQDDYFVLKSFCSQDGSRVLVHAGKEYFPQEGKGAVLLDAITGDIIKKFPGIAPETGLAISFDQKKLAIGMGYKVNIYDTEDNKLSISLFTGQISSLNFSPDGTKLAVCGNGQIHLYDLNLNEFRAEIGVFGKWFEHSAKFASDGQILVSNAGEQRSSLINFWDINNRSLLMKSLQVQEPGLWQNEVAISPNKEMIAQGYEAPFGRVGHIELRDMQGQLLSKFFYNGIRHIEFFPDGSILAIAGEPVSLLKLPSEIAFWYVQPKLTLGTLLLLKLAQKYPASYFDLQRNYPWFLTENLNKIDDPNLKRAVESALQSVKMPWWQKLLGYFHKSMNQFE